MKEVYIVHVAHKAKNGKLNEIDVPTTVESIWKDINKANKHCEELNKRFEEFHFWVDWHKLRD